MKRSYVAPKLELIGSIQQDADELDGSTRGDFVGDKVSGENSGGDARGSIEADDGRLFHRGNIVDVFGLLRGWI